MKRFLSMMLLASLVPAPALAIPGETTAQFLAWSRSLDRNSKPIQGDRDEMSGGIAYHKLIHAGTAPGHIIYFSAEPTADGTIHYESLAVQGVGTMDSYDIRKHRNVAMSVLSWVYGANVAIDFAEARLVVDERMQGRATHIAVYRGKRFGYQLAGVDVEVMRLRDVDDAVRQAKACSTGECGD